MNYTKPEVSTLGDAKKAIEFNGHTKPYTFPLEPVIGATQAPAYDLDE